jgi:hypothetical protein
MTIFLITGSYHGESFTYAAESRDVAQRVHDKVLDYYFTDRWEPGTMRKPQTTAQRKAYLMDRDIYIYQPEAIEPIDEWDVEDFEP